MFVNKCLINIIINGLVDGPYDKSGDWMSCGEKTIRRRDRIGSGFQRLVKGATYPRNVALHQHLRVEALALISAQGRFQLGARQCE